MSGRTTFGRRQAQQLLDNDPRLQKYMNRQYDLWVWIYWSVDQAIERWRNKPQVGDSKPGMGAVTFRPRDHFRSDGKPKRAFSEDEARVLAAEYDAMRAYQCWVCQEWHVGHKVVAVA